MTSTEPTSTSSGTGTKCSSATPSATSSDTNNSSNKETATLAQPKQQREPKPVMSEDERTKSLIKKPSPKVPLTGATQQNSLSDAGCVAEDFLIANTNSNMSEKEKEDTDDQPSIIKHGGWIHPLEDMPIQRKMTSKNVVKGENPAQTEAHINCSKLKNIMADASATHRIEKFAVSLITEREQKMEMPEPTTIEKPPARRSPPKIKVQVPVDADSFEEEDGPKTDVLIARKVQPTRKLSKLRKIPARILVKDARPMRRCKLHYQPRFACPHICPLCRCTFQCRFFPGEPMGTYSVSTEPAPGQSLGQSDPYVTVNMEDQLAYDIYDEAKRNRRRLRNREVEKHSLRDRDVATMVINEAESKFEEACKSPCLDDDVTSGNFGRHDKK